MKSGFIRLVAVLSAVCITAGSMLYPEMPQNVAAKTIAEIDAEKKKKQNEINAKQQELDSLANDISKQEAYQKALQEKIDLINSKLLLIDSQLYSLYADIDAKEADIAQLEVDIVHQQQAVENGLDEFKSRIRTMYVHGNDSLLSALVGASNFYDVLAKIDLINRVAKHDDEMVEDLNAELQSLSKNQEDLAARVQALNLKVTETESIQKEFNESRAELDDAMTQSEEAKKELEQEQLEAAIEISMGKQDLIKLEEERDQIIIEEARKAAEEARRKEEARKKAEAEAKRKAEEEARKKQTTAPVNNGGGKTTTTKTTTKAPVTQQPVYRGGKLAWPAPGFYHISSPFGWRWGRNHNGIDISGGGIQGSNACAAASGTVTKIYTGCSHNYSGFCGCNYGWGNYVMISHGNGMVTLYAHLQHVSVSVGQSVSAGTVVGKIGSTGNSTGFHLHFGVLVNGSYVNPQNYLN